MLLSFCYVTHLYCCNCMHNWSILYCSMNNKWKIIERVIALIFIIGGGSLLYLEWTSFHNLLNILLQRTSIENLSSIYFLKIFHLFFLIPVASLVAGVLLLLHKKTGWILCASVSLLFIFLTYIPVHGKSDYFNDMSKVAIWLISFSVFCLTIFITLLLKPFREKYKPTKTNWMIIFLIVGLVFLDRILV